MINLFSCCCFSNYKNVCFKLPNKCQWEIRSSNEDNFTINGDSFFLNVVPNEPLGIIAYSLELKKEVGTIYPYDNELTESKLFSAQIFNSLVLASKNSKEEKMYYLSKFNWHNFIAETINLKEDIWKVNKEIVLKKIADGTFKKSDLKIEKTK